MSTETVPKGYKRTEVGVIPEEWELANIASVVREPIRNGYSPVCPAEETGIWILSLAAVTHYGFNENGIKPAPNTDPKIDENLLVIDDIVVSRSNTPERVGLAGIYNGTPEKCAYPDLLMRVRLSSRISSRFLLSQLLSRFGRKYFLDNARGSSGSMVKIDRTILQNFPVLLPSEAEQQAIAAALTDADALIESLEQLLAKKRQIKQGAMQELLTGKRRLPGFTGKWEARKIGTIGSTYGGLTGKTKADFEVGTARYVTFMSVMKDVRINPANFGKVRVGENESQNRVLHGDLIFNGSSETPEEVALCALLETGIENLYLNSFCFGFRIREESQVNGLYLVYYIRSREGRELMKVLAQGSTRYNMSKPALMDSSIAIPTLPEQTAIAAVLSDMDAELEAIEAKLDKARQVKQGMMQQLLTGKVRLV